MNPLKPHPLMGAGAGVRHGRGAAAGLRRGAPRPAPAAPRAAGRRAGGVPAGDGFPRFY